MQADSENKTQSRCSFPEIERVDGLWFNDGNIVIVVEDKGFRVYKGILSQHSVVFKDMFAADTPLGSSGMLGCAGSVHDEVDGIPAVQLQGDSATDFSNFLKLLYDWTFLYDKETIAFTVASGLLRISTKYMAGTVRRAVIKLIKSVYTPSIIPPPRGKIEDFDGKEFAYFNLAHELNVKSILPYVYRDICKHPLEKIQEEISNPSLPVLWSLIIGREKMHNYEALHLIPEIQLSKIADHANDFECRKHILFHISKHQTHLPDGFSGSSWPEKSRSDSPRKICFSCKDELWRILLNYHNGLTLELPRFFKMEEWSRLEKLDKESTMF